MTFDVVLNGTDTNPYHQWGLKQNPFPQIARYEYASHLLHLAKLGGDPIPDTDYIRKHLEGWLPAFIDLCCKNFRKGEVVKFRYSFDENH